MLEKRTATKAIIILQVVDIGIVYPDIFAIPQPGYRYIGIKVNLNGIAPNSLFPVDIVSDGDMLFPRQPSVDIGN